MKKSNLKNHVCTVGLAAVLWALALTARAQYSTEVLSLNPLVYYRLNEPAATVPFADAATNSSSLGAAANGYYVGTITHPDTSALIGGMTAETSIAGGIIEMPYLNNWASSNVFGAEMWFDVNPGVAGVLCCNVNLDGRYGWILYYGEDGADIVSLRMYNGNGTAVFVLATSPVMTESVWHHVMTQSDGTNAWIYIDGTNAAEVVVPPGYIPPSLNHACPLDVFGREDNSFRSTGVAAQFAIYTNTLTSAKILNHYKTGIASSPAPDYKTLVLSDGAYAYWALNDAAYTAPSFPVAANSGSLGTGGDGTYLPGTAPGAAGPPFAGMSGGGACYFNGLSGAFDGDATGSLPGYIDISAGGGVDSVTFGSNITLIAWFQREAWVSDFQTIFGNGDAADNTWRLERNGGGNSIQFGLNSSAAGTPFFGVVGSVDQIADSAWHHVAGVYDGTNVSFYIDGMLDTRLSEPGMTINAAAALASIGEDTGIGAPYGRVWCGNISEVAVFTNALSEAEVTALYDAAEPAPSFMQPPAFAPPIYEGETVTLSVVANGALPLAYQWTSNAVVISNQTTTGLTLTSVHPSFDASYAVIVSNKYGVVTSTPTILSVISGPPVILTQPAATALRYLTGSATLSVLAVGAVPITYQWQFDGAPISGATASSLILTGLGSASAGTYNVVLNNPHGTLTSSNEVLTILVPTNYPSAIMSLGPQAYWRLNETNGTTATDYASGYNGTIGGAVTVGNAAPPLLGLAGTGAGSYYFNGISGVVDTTLLVSGDQGTFMALINTTNPVDLVGILDARGGPGSSCSMELYTDGLTLQYTWDNQADTYNYPPTVAKSGLQAVASTWCFAAVSVGESQTVLYMDNGTGLQSETNEAPSFGVTNTGPMLIGRDTAWYYFPGWIGEGAYFNRALSPAEITTLDQVLFSNTPVAAPQILVQPAPQPAFVGSSASFTVSAVGALPLSYQWQFDNTNIPGATGQTLVVPGISYANAGSYQVIVNNSVGSSNSLPAVLTVLDPPVAVNVTDGLVGHYKFDNDFTDASGHNHDGIPEGLPTFTNGFIGSGAVLVSDDKASIFNCVDVGDPIDFQFNALDSFSVSLWVNYTGTPGDLPFIGNALCSTGNAGWVLTDSFYDDGGGNVTCSIEGNTNNAYFTVTNHTGPMNDGNWHQFVFVNDRVNSQCVAYADGLLARTVPVPRPLGSLNPGYVTVIGSDPTASYGGPAGYGCGANGPGGYAIDDVGIWRRVLSADEVAGIYSAGTNGVSFDKYGPVQLNLTLNGAGHLQLTWQQGTLESAPALTGPWTPVTGATPPTYVVTPSGAQEFYRVQ